MVTHQQAEHRVNAGFWIHMACYIVVVSALAVLNYQRNPDNLWVLWVAGGWGIGIVVHAVTFFTSRGKLIDRVEARMNHREERQERRDARHDASKNRAEDQTSVLGLDLSRLLIPPQLLWLRGADDFDWPQFLIGQCNTAIHRRRFFLAPNQVFKIAGPHVFVGSVRADVDIPAFFQPIPKRSEAPNQLSRGGFRPVWNFESAVAPD